MSTQACPTRRRSASRVTSNRHEPLSVFESLPERVAAALKGVEPPWVMTSATADVVAIIGWRAIVRLSALKAPLTTVAGMRINPLNLAPHRQSLGRTLAFLELGSGHYRRVSIPRHQGLVPVGFSPDGSHFAFGLIYRHRVELWVASTSTGSAIQLIDQGITAVGLCRGRPLARWCRDGTALAVLLADEPAAHCHRAARSRPVCYEHSGPGFRTVLPADLSIEASDGDKIFKYLSSRLAICSVTTRAVDVLGEAALIDDYDPSPDGRYFVVSVFAPEFPPLMPVAQFGTQMEIWTAGGDRRRWLDAVTAIPVPGVGPGPAPRCCSWYPTAKGTLTWIQDRDDTGVGRVGHIMTWAIDSQAAPRITYSTTYRLDNLRWTSAGTALFTEEDSQSGRRARALRLTPSPEILATFDTDHPLLRAEMLTMDGSPFGTVFERDSAVYLKVRRSALTQLGGIDAIRLDSGTLARVFTTPPRSAVDPVGIVNGDGVHCVAFHESPFVPPRLMLYGLTQKREKQLREFPSISTALSTVGTRRLTYVRKDGLRSATHLLLPPDYDGRRRLPLIFFGHPTPLERAEQDGITSFWSHRFLRATHLRSRASTCTLLFALCGYAVLRTTLPIVGKWPLRTSTYVEQTIDGATAAVQAAVDLGVADPERVGIVGHSMGGLAAANMLARTKLFRAAATLNAFFNMSLVPSDGVEFPTLWEKPDLYHEMSPFASAARIATPLLIIQGTQDEAPGDIELQATMMFLALRHCGVATRYVRLPYEGHTLMAAESIGRAFSEMSEWFRRYL